MASHPEPLDILLSAIPSLPRAALDRLVVQALDRMDQLDPDPDFEDSETGNHLVDERGRWIGGDAPNGPWYEDDEEPGDLEGIDEREPMEFDDEAEVGCAPPGAFKSREAHLRRIRITRCHRIERRRSGWLDVRYSLRMSTRAATLTVLRRRHPQLRQRKRRP